jgi:hypothetical protein
LYYLFKILKKVVQMIELKRFRGAPNGYPFAPLTGLERVAAAGGCGSGGMQAESRVLLRLYTCSSMDLHVIL